MINLINSRSRWSIYLGLMVALFWTGYYLLAGSVPVVTSLKMTNSWTITFLAISRWWDILAILIVASIFRGVWQSSGSLMAISDDAKISMAFAILYGVVFSPLVLGYAISIGYAIFMATMGASLFGFIIGITIGFHRAAYFRAVFPISAGAVFMLTSVLVCGVPGLILGAGFGLTILSAFGFSLIVGSFFYAWP